MAASRDDRAAIDKAFSLLAAFGPDASGGVGVSELARRSSLSKSTAFRVLQLLERNGVVERVGRDYRFGERLVEFGSTAYAPENEVLRELLTPFLADLYEQTHHTVHLATLHGADVVYLAKLYGHRHVSAPSRVGGRVPAHATAVGKAMLAHCPELVDDLFAEPLVSLTKHTISDPAVLAQQLADVRRDGMSVERGESAPGLGCLGVAVLDARRCPVAGLSVSGPLEHIDPVAHGVALRRAAFAAHQVLQRARVRASAARGTLAAS